MSNYLITHLITFRQHESWGQAALRSDLAATLWALVEQLPAEQRTAVQLRFRDRLSVTEAAQSVGCSDGAFKSRTHRALVSLHKAVGTGTTELLNY